MEGCVPPQRANRVPTRRNSWSSDSLTGPTLTLRSRPTTLPADLPQGQDLPREYSASGPPPGAGFTTGAGRECAETQSKLQAPAFLGECAHAPPGMGARPERTTCANANKLQAPAFPREPYSRRAEFKARRGALPQSDRKCTDTSKSPGVLTA
jgi:hypothetical protein